jgi:uncharacterized membrane protein
MNHADFLCQISPVLPSALRRPITVVELAALAVFWVCVIPACSSGNSSSTCPDSVPTSCPSPAPTFAADVAPLIQSHCTSCHGPGQQIPTLGTYANIADAATQQHVLFQVQTCTMPPAPKTPLTAQQRDTILSWLVCGAMND